MGTFGKQFVIGALAVALATVGVVQAAESRTDLLIREVESLRTTLSLRDSARAPLTLRLADLYFDRSVALSRDGRDQGPTSSVAKQARTAQQSAVTLYEEALSGAKGSYAPASAVTAPKIKFQLARLYSDLGRSAESIALFKELSNQSEFATIQRESVVRLAEIAEDSGRSEEALAGYGRVLELCGGLDVCSYARYRRAWIQYRADQILPAIAEMKTALYDSKGQIREESLRDLITFLGHAPQQISSELVWAEELSLKLGRPQILDDLSASYFAAGQKAAAVQVLEYTYSKRPTLMSRARILEEAYGQRDWAKVRTLMQATGSPAEIVALNQSNQKDAAEVEKILKRLTVQLDAERKSQPSISEDFQRSVMLYLEFFPTSSVRAQMIDGWIAAESDPAKKIEQLRLWISEPGVANAEVTRLREIRASAAQKSGQQAIVAEEMGHLAAGAASGSAKQREYTYLRARALYEMKDTATALPLFESLAYAPAGSTGSASANDQWAVQSMHLTLDIYNQRKDFAAINRGADRWLNDSARMGNPAAKKEEAELIRIRDQARFEQATGAATASAASPTISGEASKTQALATFKAFCLARQYLPKSCENGRILAIQLHDQAALLAILEATNPSEYASELEASAYFAKAAKQLEAGKSASAANLHDSLKLTILYELDGQTADAKRVMSEMLARPAMLKGWTEQDQALVRRTMTDLGMIDAKALGMPWSSGQRVAIAEQLEAMGKPSAETRKLIMSQAEMSGPAWARYTTAEIEALDAKQKTVGFYGKNGQRRFETRLSALKNLTKRADLALKGSDAVTRAKIAERLANSHRELAAEILASPLPANVTGEVAEQVKAQLKEMAAPFAQQADQYTQLGRDQAAVAASSAASSGSADQIRTGQAAPARESLVAQYYAELHRDPQNRAALDQLKSVYQTAGQTRLSAYFEGRISALSTGTATGAATGAATSAPSGPVSGSGPGPAKGGT